MKLVACLATVVALAGCSTPGFFTGQNAAPRWSPAQTQPVISEKWVDGFVPVEQFKMDTLAIFGNGSWTATREFGSGTGSPSVVVASGSISQEALSGLLAKAFERPFGGQSFLDLPARIDPGITDVGYVTLAVSIDNASHSVTVVGTKPEAFVRFEQAIASQTVAVPFNP